MTGRKDRIDWSEERYREMLVNQRKYLWYEDTLDKLAVWMGLRQGITAVDVGCGLGYLGFTYWKYFGNGGYYHGLDESANLLADAGKLAAEWAVGGRADFVIGNANALPFPDDFADWTMCQTLLMHLADAEGALREMVRITKPGGLIMCKEPDNVSAELMKGYSSLPELTLEEEILSLKVTLLCHKGRLKLGRGDNSIGARISILMTRLGLVDVDIRLNDRVYHVEPPYESPMEQHWMEMLKKDIKDNEDEEKRQYWIKRGREEFLAGGGSEVEYEQAVTLWERNRPIRKQMIEDGTLAYCSCGSFFVIKGRKPKAVKKPK
jgi:SAM-dependent methyltransferase